MHSIFKPISQFLWTILLDFLQILVRRKVPMPTVHRPSLKRNWISSHLIIIFLYIYKEFTLNKKLNADHYPLTFSSCFDSDITVITVVREEPRVRQMMFSDRAGAFIKLYRIRFLWFYENKIDLSPTPR